MLTSLKVSIQDVQRYAIIIQGAERIANVTVQYRVIERLYLTEKYELTIQLKDHITDLYMLVLRFLVKAKEFYMNKTASKDNLITSN